MKLFLSIVLGLLAALFAAVLVAALTTGPEGVPSLSLGNADARVVVAEKVLQAGHVITSDDVQLKKVNSVDVSTGSLRSVAPLIGRVLIREMAKGQQITAGAIAGLGTGPEIEAMLDKGFRAATITLSDRGPSQFVYPGGIVDVIAIFDIPKGYPGEGDTVSRTVLDGIRVLAVEGFSDAAAQAEAKDELKSALRTGRGPSLTLLVTPEEAQVLQLARSLGTLSVTLRPTEEATGPWQRGIAYKGFAPGVRSFEGIDVVAALEHGDDGLAERGHLPRDPIEIVVRELHRRERVVDVRVEARRDQKLRRAAHGDVERGDRFVADDEIRVEREGAGDADPLALAAGELVRIAVDVVGVEADGVQKLADLCPACFGFVDAMLDERLRDDRPDRHARVQRCLRVLEDHLHAWPHAP